ncbi:MAG: aminotransferase class V-fold PLP-dependent enzyme, partial [Fibrobacterota bacterium]
MSVFTTEQVAAFRTRFPILARTVHGKPLVYLDNAATSQMPESVISAVAEFDRTKHANVHRGVHKLSQEATDVHEGSRDRLAKFLNARRREEIVLTKGC